MDKEVCLHDNASMEDIKYYFSYILKRMDDSNRRTIIKSIGSKYGLYDLKFFMNLMNNINLAFDGKLYSDRGKK